MERAVTKSYISFIGVVKALYHLIEIENSGIYVSKISKKEALTYINNPIMPLYPQLKTEDGEVYATTNFQLLARPKKTIIKNYIEKIL